MTRLFVNRVLQNIPHLFLKHRSFRTKSTSILVPDLFIYYFSLHLKLSSPAHSTQLVDIFAYETIKSSSQKKNSITGTLGSFSTPVVVYHFHNLFSQERVFLFSSSLGFEGAVAPKSLNELFASSVWLEREVGEMHSISFEGQKDLRNLMLQYGDSSAPFRKSYPSIGVKEVSYDSVLDTLVQVPVSLQI